MFWSRLFFSYLCLNTCTLTCTVEASSSGNDDKRSELNQQKAQSSPFFDERLPDVLTINPSQILELVERVGILEDRDKAQQKMISDLNKKLDDQTEVISAMRIETRKKCAKEAIQRDEVNKIEDELTSQMKKLNTKIDAKLNNIRIEMMHRISKFNPEKPILTKGQIKLKNDRPEEKSDRKYATEVRENQTNASTGWKTGKVRRAEEEDMVAFTAGLTHDITNMGENQNIRFDRVETNIGNGYSPHHGVFIAPVAGTYVFHTSILAYYNLEIWCRITVNGINKADVFARGTDNRHDQGSQLIIVKLNKGDDVAIQNRQAGDAVHSDGNVWTTFSGFLLHQDYSLSNVVVG